MRACVRTCTLVGSVATLAVRRGRQDAGMEPTRDPEQIFGESIEYEKQTAGRGASSLVDKKEEGVRVGGVGEGEEGGK